MARSFLTSIDLNKNELLNPRAQNLASAPASPVSGQFYYDTGTSKFYWYNGSVWIDATGGVSFGTVTAQTSFGAASSNGAATTAARSDHVHGTPAHDGAAHSAIKLSDLAAPAATVAFGSQRISGLADPSSAQDAATKNYVDGVAAGLDVKASVRAATTAAGTLATAYANGQVVDGVTLATGDRILVKNQATGSENGIYTVNATGAPTRAADADASADVTAGMFAFVAEGTANADTGWVLTTNDPIVLGTTSLAFTQFSGAGAVSAGNGLTQSGTTINAVGTSGRISVSADAIDIDSGYAGQATIVTVGTIATGTWTGTDIAVADGGTGSSTAAGARANLGATGKYAATVGGATSIAVTHSLGTTDVVVGVSLVSSGAQVECDVTRTDANTVTLGFATAPSASSLRVVVIG